MEKIKRNEIVKKGILLAGVLPQIDGFTPREFYEGISEEYKRRCGDDYMFTSEEAETILTALESMPGFSREKFLALGSAVSHTSKHALGCFSWELYVIYIMLSITNPELFEDYEEEEEDGEDDGER